RRSRREFQRDAFADRWLRWLGRARDFLPWPAPAPASEAALSCSRDAQAKPIVESQCVIPKQHEQIRAVAAGCERSAERQSPRKRRRLGAGARRIDYDGHRTRMTRIGGPQPAPAARLQIVAVAARKTLSAHCVQDANAWCT